MATFASLGAWAAFTVSARNHEVVQRITGQRDPIIPHHCKPIAKQTFFVTVYARHIEHIHYRQRVASDTGIAISSPWELAKSG